MRNQIENEYTQLTDTVSGTRMCVYFLRLFSQFIVNCVVLFFVTSFSVVAGFRLDNIGS